MAENLSDVVFLFGPPFSGKTLIYHVKYSKSHQLFCQWEFVKANPNVSLRTVILGVVARLKQGDSLVIDGENALKQTRQSFIQLVRQKVQGCKFQCIYLKTNPSYGKTQCRWAWEWSIAHQCAKLPSAVYDGQADKERWHAWFDEEKTDIPDECEGFEIKTVNSRLLCSSKFKFELPALFLQWQGVRVTRDDNLATCRECTVDLVRSWMECNLVGRVIIIGDGKHSCNQDDSESHCTCVTGLKSLAAQLAQEVSVPVYYVFIKDPSVTSSFIIPPNPGLLAWLQRLHNINLQHPATLYVYSSEAHEKMANSAGVRFVKIDKILRNRKMLNTVNIRAVPQAPEFLRNSIVADFQEIHSEDTNGACAQVPLLTESRACSTGSVEAYFAGRMHGMYCRDLETLERYQTLYERSATRTEPATLAVMGFQDDETSCLKDSSVPEEKASPISRELTSCHSTNEPNACEVTDQDTSMDTANNPNPLPVVKTLSIADVISQAQSASRYARGEGCVRSITNLGTATGADGLTITCQCGGSQGQIYDVKAVVGESGALLAVPYSNSLVVAERGVQRPLNAHSLDGILSACCSCPDPAGKTGQCKHTVAMLLSYINQQGMFVPSTSGETTTTSKPKPEASSPSCSISKASTPKFKSATKSSSISSNASDKKSTRKKVAIKRTLYCMSPRELLDTAQQLLHEQRNKRPSTRSEEKLYRKSQRGDNKDESLDHAGQNEGQRLCLSDLSDEYTTSKPNDNVREQTNERRTGGLETNAKHVTPETMEVDSFDPDTSQRTMRASPDNKGSAERSSSDVNTARHKRFDAKSILDELI